MKLSWDEMSAGQWKRRAKIDRHLRQTKVQKTGSEGRNICLVILVQDTDREG
jgi:hypothetical protein